MKKIMPIQTSTRPETKNFLTSSNIQTGNAVALNSAGQLVIADRTIKDASHVVGFATKAHTGGTVVTMPTQVGGTLANAGWSFPNIGKPVYLDTAGSLTQDTSSFPDTSYLVQVGVALGANQISINIHAPLLLRAIQDEDLALASGVVFKEFTHKDRSKEMQSGKLIQFDGDGNTITTIDDVNVPAEGGTLLTTNSQLICVDYGG